MLFVERCLRFATLHEWLLHKLICTVGQVKLSDHFVVQIIQKTVRCVSLKRSHVQLSLLIFQHSLQVQAQILETGIFEFRHRAGTHGVQKMTSISHIY